MNTRNLTSTASRFALRRLGLLGLLALAACLTVAAVAPVSGSVAAGLNAPAWKLTLSSQPTNFAPGSSQLYQVLATNVGGAAATGPVTFTDTLPEGLTPTHADGRDWELHGASCEVADQTATCTASAPVQADEIWELGVSVEVDPSLAEGATLENEVTVVGGGAPMGARAMTTTTISSDPAPFGFLPGNNGFGASLTAPDGVAATQAGSHPGNFDVDLGLPTVQSEGQKSQFFAVDGGGRDARSILPRGLALNPSATPVRCTEAELQATSCPNASAIGVATIQTLAPGLLAYESPLYNMVPPPGAPVSLGFDAAGAGIYVHIFGGVHAGDLRLFGGSNDLLATLGNPLLGVQLQFWGDPSSPIHDATRGSCLPPDPNECPVKSQSTPLLTMPTACTESLQMDAEADSWGHPGAFHTRGTEVSDAEGNPTAADGCNALAFEPQFESKPTTNLAESPSGLDFNLHQPQSEELESQATAALKDISVTLPQGMTLNPAAADGLQGCGSVQAGLTSAIGQSPIRFDGNLAKCPDASRLGTFEVTTPLLARYDEEEKLELDPETGKPIPDPLHGSVFLAKPFDNPFGSLLAIYLALEDEKTGIVIKLAGKVSPDPNTGQLVVSFSEAPELPVEDVRLHLFGGARAPLISPPLCGTHTTTATLTPWSSPEGRDVHESSSFETSAFPGGGNCPTSAAAAPNAPAFNAGTIAPQAGAYSPFGLKLSREDGSQRLTGLDTTLAPGLIGKLAGVAKCSEAQIAAAKAREAPNLGVIEQANPSCPASSEVGTVDVAGGAGPTPLYVKGRVYLAGPYKGAPLSLVVITPAVAGPFDLGVVVIRAALYVNAPNAQIHAVSDPFPSALEGIPLDVRSVALSMDRPSFTLNPTNCDPMKIIGSAPTTTGQVAALSNPFQVGGCSGLGFKPKLALKLKGGTKRGGHPALQATYTPRQGDANLKSLVVRLPRSAFLDQAHIRTICTRVQFAAKACPPGAQYGFIKAWTPLLEEPLEGPVYLRSSDHNLPDLVFDLHGAIDVEVATRIDSVHGGIRATIESAPDAPLSKAVLEMQGARKGLIINSRNLCGGVNRAGVELTGQNGKVADSKPELKAKCGKQRHRKHGHKHAR